MDTAYIDHINGRFEAYTYTESGRYLIAKDHDRAHLAKRVRSLHFRIVFVGA